MLVIDSEKLSQQIHETESDYMEKSKEVLANSQETEGAKYQGKVLNRKKSYTTACSGLSFVLFGSCFRVCLENHSQNLLQIVTHILRKAFFRHVLENNITSICHINVQ